VEGSGTAMYMAQQRGIVGGTWPTRKQGKCIGGIKKRSITEELVKEEKGQIR